MAAAAAQRRSLRLLGKRVEVSRFVARQQQIDGQAERRIDRQQLAVAAEFERCQPGGIARTCLAVMTVGGWLMLGMVMMLRTGLGGLDGGEQRADMNHQHGEQAKPDAHCRKPFACHRRVLRDMTL